MAPQILPLTGLEVGRVHDAVLTCGDPARADKIAQQLDNSQLVSERREYRAYNGTFAETAVTVCSHGIGAPGAAIAFEELITAGAKRIIRVGSCGSLQPDIQSGDLIIATAAVQATGYGRETVPEGYPSVADMDLTVVLRDTAVSHNHPHRTGIVITRDNFYNGVTTTHTPSYTILAQANVLAVEMECAALFIVGSLRSIATAAILAVDGNVLHSGETMDDYQPHRQVVANAIEAEIQIALKALTQFKS